MSAPSPDIAIDKLGRAVIPKHLRERYHLHAGTRLRVREDVRGFYLEPIDDESADGHVKLHSDGLPIFTGTLPADFDPQGFMDGLRTERDRQILGSDRQR